MKYAVLFAAALFAAYQFLPKDSSPKPPVAVATGPVASVMQSASSTDRKTLAALYTALADVTQRDGANRQISTTGIWRRFHSAALRLAVGGTELPGKYPGLDKAVEEVLAQHFSLDDVALTDELRSKVVAACREVASQSGG